MDKLSLLEVIIVYIIGFVTYYSGLRKLNILFLLVSILFSILLNRNSILKVFDMITTKIKGKI